LARTVIGYPVAREPVPPQDLPKPLHNALSLTFRDCAQPESIPDVKLEDCRVGERRDKRAATPIFAALTGPATSECEQVMPEAGSR
jgi:hypothetical protein